MPRADQATIDRLTDYFDGEPDALNAMGMGLGAARR